MYIISFIVLHYIIIRMSAEVVTLKKEPLTWKVFLLGDYNNNI